MNIENQNYDPLIVNHSNGDKPRADIPIKDIKIPDCWHVSMRAHDAGDHNGKRAILDCWHLAHDLHDKLLRLGEQPARMNRLIDAGYGASDAQRIVDILDGTAKQAEVEEQNQAHGKHPDQGYIEAAKAGKYSSEIEVDEGAKVSHGDEPGAYVQAWVWIPDEEAAP